MQGEDGQKSKASAPGMARHEPPGRDLRRLYDLPVFSVAGAFLLFYGQCAALNSCD
ncbi:hypothetical protein YEP4_08667 [Yersinia enterocolitica subsp. palearctica YE-P4]|nr:hypothetical protein IOK_05401 [Yersinia enterocolitica subsp. palearctica PhRBD_Ye1]EOR68202.1 hypothetical protein YE149_08754 [Yersinia enterocolitica subsp. palearctica YE-149]EOR77275.1 hypothetical protein YE150_08709 [Yersinia enterocolitica subsp. palearctica YE-150]EOR77838.1 hypothetical protein YEP1_08765 [Yersinia enterocolitica subsp. palearctica YE-P1]EOR82332.1 hypothetical protein YEP4_08667 [Yersinia enterocolitica subsp. palearctica YE-P4]